MVACSTFLMLSLHEQLHVFVRQNVGQCNKIHECIGILLLIYTIQALKSSHVNMRSL